MINTLLCLCMLLVSVGGGGYMFKGDRGEVNLFVLGITRMVPKLASRNLILGMIYL